MEDLPSRKQLHLSNRINGHSPYNNNKNTKATNGSNKL